MRPSKSIRSFSSVSISAYDSNKNAVATSSNKRSTSLRVVCAASCGQQNPTGQSPTGHWQVEGQRTKCRRKGVDSGQRMVGEGGGGGEAWDGMGWIGMVMGTREEGRGGKKGERRKMQGRCRGTWRELGATGAGVGG